MNIKVKRLFPSRFELISLLVITLIILVAGNSKSLLQYYGLDSSTQVLSSGTQHVLGSGLGFLDGFSFTSRIVTFLVWAFVGLFCFSLVQSVGATYQKVKQERSLSSFRYVHPADFSKRMFWQRVSFDFSTLLASLVLMAILLYGFFALILPIGLQYGHELLFKTSLRSIGGFLLALTITYLWLLLLDMCLRLLSQRHHLIA